MALDVNLLRNSFDLVLLRNPELTARFYEILFERYPQVRPMFRSERRKQQEAMLAQALLAVVEHLDDPAWLTSTLGALGSKHVGYGVTREMYDWVGDALLRTLAEAAGADWTPRHQEQWAAAYGVIVDLMNEPVAAAAE